MHKQVLREMICYRIVSDLALGDKSWRCRKLTREQSLSGSAPTPGSPAASTAPSTATERPNKVQRTEATGNDGDADGHEDEDEEQNGNASDDNEDDGGDL